MYEAIEYFLLGDPKKQIEQLGDVEGLIAKGNEAKSIPDYFKARYSYETAAKIKLYRGSKDSLRTPELRPRGNRTWREILQIPADHTKRYGRGAKDCSRLLCGD